MPNQTIQYFKKLIQTSGKINRIEKDILIRRLEGKTLKIIGKKYHLSAERIRQIEENVLKKYVRKIYQLLLFKRSLTKKENTTS